MEQNNIRLITVLFLLVLQLTTIAQIKPMINSKTKWETFYENVPVTGEIRVGVMGHDSEQKVAPNKFYVRIPNHKEKILCVDISSIDGRYQAKLPYDISKLAAGTHEFELPTLYVSELSKYSMNEIVILSKIGKDCNSFDYYYVLSSWNKFSESSKKFFIYLNSANPVFFKFKNANKNVSIECQPIKTQIKAAAYNCKCEIPLKDINYLENSSIHQRVRTLNNIQFKPYPFPLKI